MKEASVRAVRTFVQAFLGAYLSGVVSSELDGIRALASVGAIEAAFVAGFIAAVTFVYNLLENTVPAIDTRG